VVRRARRVKRGIRNRGVQDQGKSDMQHVVVVEDDKMNARLFEAALVRRGGFQVTVTEDVALLLKLAEAHDVDLVIMDVSLSHCLHEGHLVDGLEITRMLKDNPLTADVPVLLATAHAMHGDREHFLAASKADDYVSKPILDLVGLIERINQLIERKKEGRPC
jgi:two-component system cell cycle response regulator DivK